jgi:hypothetical protein
MAGLQQNVICWSTLYHCSTRLAYLPFERYSLRQRETPVSELLDGPIFLTAVGQL